MTKYKVENITWDVDNEEELENLPISCEIEAIDEDNIADALSDEYGFCVVSFNLE